MDGKMPKLKKAQHEVFAQAIFKGSTITDAAIEAGYSEKTAHAQGSRLLKNVKVSERVKELQNRVENKNIASVTERKEILTELARGNLTDYLEMLPDGATTLTFEKDSPNPRAVLEVTEQMVVSDETVEVRKKKIKMHNPIAAIHELNKMEGQHSPDKMESEIHIHFDKQDEKVL